MNLIVAVDRNWAIGRGGDQLVYLSADLKRFKRITMGHTVILGRKTLSTFPGGRPLTGRRNLILSRDPDFTAGDAEIYPDPGALCAAVDEDAFVIGGASVYRALLPRCHTAYVTRLDEAFPADAFFPNLDADPAWELTNLDAPLEEAGLSFRYALYQRRLPCI